MGLLSSFGGDLSYNISRPVKIPWFKRTVIGLGLIYLIIITLINVVSTGYETINYSSLDFNGTHGLWYDVFVPGRPSNYNHRSCEAALVKNNDYFTTNSNFGFFLYQLVNFIDPTHNLAVGSIDTLNYSNNAFTECTVHSLSMSVYLTSVGLELEAPAIVGCNTTSNKYMFFQAASDSGTVSYLINTLNQGRQFNDFVAEYFGPGPINVQNATILMFAMARKLFTHLASYTTVLNQYGEIPTPFLRYSLIGGDAPVSYIQMVYSDTNENTTPAYGSWTMSVGWKDLLGLNQVASNIVFLPNLGLDVSASTGFIGANATLFPTIGNMSAQVAQAGVTNFNFWELINWIFVVQYWGLLADFGQIAPTMWDWTNGTLQNYGPISVPATNNIFVNESLFELYYDYFNSTVAPLFGAVFPPFEPLSETNQLGQSNVSLRTLYACSDLTLKSSQSVVISLIVADWVFITSFFTIALVIGTFLHTRGNENANICEGCELLLESQPLPSRSNTAESVAGKANPTTKAREIK